MGLKLKIKNISELAPLGFLFLVILSAAAYSTTTQEVNLDIKESVVVAGKNITFVSIGSNNKLLVAIDGDQHIISSTETEDLDGVHITPGLIYDANRWRNLSIDFTIVVDYICGDGTCETTQGESNFNCCLDCNCSSTYTCYNNKCFKSDLVKCISDEECDDNNLCTRDYCNKELPIICMHEDIKCNEEVEEIINKTNVTNNSVEIENTTEENKTPSLEDDFCTQDTDCNDNNSDTIDKCSIVARLCYYADADEVKNTITGNVVVESQGDKGKNSLVKRVIDWVISLFS